MELIIIRHGETAWTRTRQHTGTTEIALTDDGAGEARRLEPFLSRLLRGRQAVVYSSPRERALQTARLALPNADLIVQPLIAELDYGRYEGLTSAEIRSQDPAWDIWRDGCPGGESPADAGRRAAEFLDECVSGAESPVVAVTHGHFSRILAVTAVRRPPSDGAMLASATASVSIVGEHDGRPAISLWNYTVDR